MNIFIGTIAKCSTGYTLNAASYLLMLSEDWSYSNNSHAHDRIHRINNTKPAFIKVLACADTIDDRVH
jgi:SNF2 family DNA or RNA helicase